MNYSNFTFADVFPEWEDWSANISDSIIKLLDSSSGIGTGVLHGFDEEYFYPYLLAMFGDREFNYNSPLVIYNRCKLVYTDILLKAYAQMEQTFRIYKLTAEEIDLLAKTISNNSDNPNFNPTDPTEPLPFVSYQNSVIQKSNKFQSALFAIQNMPTLGLGHWIKERSSIGLSFEDLFKWVDTDELFIYDK